jgi:hypothetical protein
MDHAILTVLILIIIYMVVRDIVVRNRRRERRLLLKRISRKFDVLAKEAQSQNKLFNKLLDILSKEEDD